MQCFQIVFDLVIFSYTYSWYSKSLLSPIYQYALYVLTPSVPTCSDAFSRFTNLNLYFCLPTCTNTKYMYKWYYFQHILYLLWPLLSVYFRLPYTDTLSITYLVYHLYWHFKCTLYLFIPMLSLYLIFVFNDTLIKQETYLLRCSLYTSYFLVSTISFWIRDTSLIWYF